MQKNYAQYLEEEKKYTLHINMTTFCWKLSISWVNLEAISASYPDPKNLLPRLFMSS